MSNQNFKGCYLLNQKQIVGLHKELYEELSSLAVKVKKNINAIPNFDETEKSTMAAAVDAMVGQAKQVWDEAQDVLDKVEAVTKKVKDVKIDKNMKKEEVMNKLDETLAAILKAEKPEDSLKGPNTFQAEPRKPK